ncbi:MAG: MBL fold metallo-hydrolase [Hyphomicrobiales bacterium]
MSDIDFDTAFEPRYGEPMQLSALVRRIACNNPGPFTGSGTNTYLVGRGAVAVIDPGPENDAHYAAIRAATAGERVSHIVITHTHADHSPLARRLQAETGAKTYGFGPHGAGRPAPEGLRLDASGDHAFVPDVAVRHGDPIDGDGFRLEAVFTPGHTSNHMAYALDAERTLFTGDHVMAWATSVIAPPDGHMASYMASLRTLIERANDELYLPGHGPPKAKPQSFARAYLAHRQMRETAILEAIRAGHQRVGHIVPLVYKGLDPKLHAAAGLSTLAHVEHLIEQAKVRALDDDADPALRRYAAV